MEKRQLTRRGFLEGLAGLGVVGVGTGAGLQSKRAYSDDIRIDNLEGPAVIDMGDPSRWHQPVVEQGLSKNYDLNDLKRAFGPKWDALSPSQKQRTERLWEKADPQYRKSICEIYNSPDEFINQNLTKEQRAEFERFTAGKYWMMREEVDKRMRMHSRYNGATRIPLFRRGVSLAEVKKEYDASYPWEIDFDCPGYEDGLIIFLYEKQNKKNRLNPEIMAKGRRPIPY